MAKNKAVIQNKKTVGRKSEAACHYVASENICNLFKIIAFIKTDSIFIVEPARKHERVDSAFRKIFFELFHESRAYAMMAADANADGNVDTLDAYYLRQSGMTRYTVNQRGA